MLDINTIWNFKKDSSEKKYNLRLVDEGQDLSDKDWTYVGQYLNDEKSLLIVNYDPFQKIY